MSDITICAYNSLLPEYIKITHGDIFASQMLKFYGHCEESLYEIVSERTQYQTLRHHGRNH